MANSTQHRWQFTRSGGFDQAKLESAADFAHLEDLDQKLWAALACPVHGLEFDERTLALIDSDDDGRVRAPEVIAAVQWCEDNLNDLAALKNGSDSLPLAQISAKTDSGRAILASAKQILKDLGKPDAAAISLADVTDTAKIFAQTRFNGDGVVPADAASDEPTQKAVADVIACMGAVTDRSGKPGVDGARVDAFFKECAALDAWMTACEKDGGPRVLGDATAAAVDALKAVRPKVDDYFARCKLAAFDPRSLAAVNRQQDEYLAVAAKDLTITAAEVAGFPLSKIEPNRPLDLTTGINPAWEAAIATLRAAVVTPVYGKDKKTLTVEEWTALGAKLAGYEAWLAAKPATSVEKLGVARVRELLAGGAQAAIGKLLAQDLALAKEAETIGQVERLVRYHRDLNRLLNNFVNFSDFYSGTRKAVFQSGTLYLDGRACELCVHVADGAKHAALAGMSKAYLAYCDCTRPSGEKMSIAAAFTGGDSDYLIVGRNGIFYDRKGRDWDATIVRVVENPISIRQAFWAPYKKLVRLLEDLAAKRAAEKQAESDAKLAAAAASAAHPDQPKAPEPPPVPKKIDIGTVAAMAVAVGALGTMATAIVTHAQGLMVAPFWLVCLVFAALMLVISGPSMLIAWLKLRQRNMGPILDANGWAVNGRVKMNVPFGASLTSVAALPPGSLPASADPYGEKRSPWPGILKVAVIALFLYSFLDWHAWIWQGAKAFGAPEDKIPGMLTSPADVKEREKRAKEEEQKAEDAKKAPEKK